MAQIRNFIIDQGSSFSADINVEPYGILLNCDIEDIEVIGNIKKSYWSNTVVGTLNFTVLPEEQKIIMYLIDEETNIIPIGKYEYDVIAKDNNKKIGIRLIEGVITIRQ